MTGATGDRTRGCWMFTPLKEMAARLLAVIGVRMALGAQGRQVSWLVLKRGLWQLAIGLTLGLAGALALGRVLQRILVGITPADPLTFAAITKLLTVVSTAACLLPARRATQVDPLVALRTE